MRLFLLCGVLGLALVAGCDDGGTGTTGNGGFGGMGTGGSTSGGSGPGTSGSTTSGSTGGMGGAGTTSSTGSETTSSTGAPDLCESASTTTAFFANEVMPIFGQSCGAPSSCHFGALPSEGLSLKTGEAYAELVGKPAKQACNGQNLVEPGSASGSYLVNKITATDVCPNEKKMPPNSPLSSANKQKIIDWICQGAANN
ncbi:MAG: PE-PGRS family protein [Polyangiaceae bacterium]|nr:PE-PGRS family protein [Polyangiaceae bacterium]